MLSDSFLTIIFEFYQPSVDFVRKSQKFTSLLMVSNRDVQKITGRARQFYTAQNHSLDLIFQTCKFLPFLSKIDPEPLMLTYGKVQVSKFSYGSCIFSIDKTRLFGGSKIVYFCNSILRKIAFLFHLKKKVLSFL